MPYSEVIKVESKMFQRSKNNIAIIIGQGKFKSVGDERYEDFSTPANDVNAVAEFLRESDLNWAEDDIITLVDETRDNIEAAKKRVEDRAKNAVNVEPTIIFVYYSGPGL